MDPATKEVFDYFVAVIGVLALAFAVKQFRDAHHHTSALEALVIKTQAQQGQMEQILKNAAVQEGRLQTLADSLPTRFVGKFPDNLDAITRLIGGAKKEILILCDFAGYGSYSNPRSFATYFEEVKPRRAGQPRVEVKLLLYSRRAGEEALPLQFDKTKYDEISKAREFTAFYSLFAKQFPTPPATFAEWDAQMWDIEESYRQALRSDGVDMRIVAKPVPVFLWIKDNEDLIASFQSSVEFGDFTFRTTDRGFIDFFRRQFDLALQDSVEYKPTGVVNPPLLV